MALRDPATEGANVPEGNDSDEFEMLELVGVGGDHGPMRSGRWLGLCIGLAVAVIGYGFVGQDASPPTPGPVRAPDDPGRLVTAESIAHRNAAGSASSTLGINDQPMTVTKPAAGATVTGGIVVTGGVVVVEAVARRPLGVVQASVSIGGVVLGCRDTVVEAAGPLKVRIPVFPPAFAAPVVLSMSSAPIGDRPGVAFTRDFRLDVPSVVGFWDATPIWNVDRADGDEILIRGYGPRSARVADIAIQGADGAVVASMSVPITDVDGCHGSVGGRIFGLGSFVARLRLPAGSTGPWTLGTRWRDAATGLELHFETSLGPIRRPTR